MDLKFYLLMLAIAFPLAGGLPLAMAGRRFGMRVGWLALIFPLWSAGALLGVAALWESPARIVVECPWVPSLGLNLSFGIDGLSLFFGLVVSLMGCLVVFYSIFYLEKDFRHPGRFYGYLVLFMGAMLGTVFADHLVLLYLFWEITGIASFLLIGFLHADIRSRVGARQALLVTASTGLVMFAGLLLLGQIAGSMSLRTILAQGLPWQEAPVALAAAMGLIMVGAFGKSAQFPFHFWLPNAMTAPTPVSAYLHSATMVKLGVYLSARLFPLFVEHPLWVPLLGGIGFFTMLLGALFALLSHDLKAILAYSSVSQLGYLIGYYGLGPAGGVEYDYLHILNHVFYKGGLFMIVGIVAHATHIRDIRQLGGLWRRMPVLGVTTLIATATMAGLPGTTGFLSKEMVLKEILMATEKHGALGYYAVACVFLASMFKVAFSARLFVNIFLGRKPKKVRRNFHHPGHWVGIPPLLLAIAAVLLGIFPGLLGKVFVYLRTPGLNHPPEHLAFWHGWTPELALSILIVAAGFGLYALGEKTAWSWYRIPEFMRFDKFFEWGLDGLSRFAARLTRLLRADSPVDYLPVIITFLVVIVGGAVVHSLTGEEALTIAFTKMRPLRVLAAGLIGLAIIGVIFLRRWTTQLISISVAGFFTSFYFVLYRAPDLALTQLLIEAVTLFMVLLLLARFPRPSEAGSEHRMERPRQWLHGALALSVGALTTLLACLAHSKIPGAVAAEAGAGVPKLGDAILSATVELAEGANAVNTLLVDFRGFDTMGEITVLLIAALGCLGLLMRYKRTPEEYRKGNLKSPGYGARHRKP